MKLPLFPFQAKAVKKLRQDIAVSLRDYQALREPQVISFTAPTGAGKTIIAADLVEKVYTGVSYDDESYIEQPNAIFVWLSDSPELNQQSKNKFDLYANLINFGQCIEIDDNFDQEMLSDGHIYFLNTQKLSKTSNLSDDSDTRDYSLWQTLKNTIENKWNRLYLIIDEAHRGARGKKAKEATTIMQTFIKGSHKHNMKPFPVIIGMSATPKRFDVLIKDVGWRRRDVKIGTEEVKKSGLLKDHIKVEYPDDMHKDMAVLDASVEEWENKCDHWADYCKNEKIENINPILVIQVANKTKTKISATNLDACLQRIESTIGHKFTEGEVAQSFGDNKANIMIDGLKVPYVSPSDIQDDKNIKVVFFKESLSTGWDCPRAEVMISFRHAKDDTYIEQLFGRMIRTPLQRHIDSDDSLNNVHLFLPFFNEEAVNDIISKFKDSEGSNIPSDATSELIGETSQLSAVDPAPENTNNDASTKSNTSNAQNAPANSAVPNNTETNNQVSTNNSTTGDTPTNAQAKTVNKVLQAANAKSSKIMRGTIVDKINKMQLPTYIVKHRPTKNYINPLFHLAHLITQMGIKDVNELVRQKIIRQISDYIESLKDDGSYNRLVKKAKELKLATRTLNPFGEPVTPESTSLFSTNANIDSQYSVANRVLGNQGIGYGYAREYQKEEGAIQNPLEYKINVILFANNPTCIDNLKKYAEDEFHNLQDTYRTTIFALGNEAQINRYKAIVGNGDSVSRFVFNLPHYIDNDSVKDGQTYTDHLYVNDDGYDKIKLDGWEKGVIKEEEKLPDFVTWLRNEPKKTWALSIPYHLNDAELPAYPDFLIVRKDESLGGYAIDILEPHSPNLADNLAKAKGFAKYARKAPKISHIEIIKQVKDKRFQRLDLAQSKVQDAVLNASTQTEWTHIFNKYGYFLNK